MSFLIIWSTVTLKKTVDKVSPCPTPLKTKNFSYKLFSRIILPSDCSMVILISLISLAFLFVAVFHIYLYPFYGAKDLLKSTNNTRRYILYSYAVSIICLKVNKLSFPIQI